MTAVSASRVTWVTDRGLKSSSGCPRRVRRTKSRNGIGRSTRSESAAPPLRPASALTASSRPVAEDPVRTTVSVPNLGSLSLNHLISAGQPSAIAVIFVEKPESGAFGAGHGDRRIRHLAEVRGTQVVRGDMQDAARILATVDEPPDGHLDLDRFSDPPRAAQKVEAAGNEVSQCPRGVLEG